MMRKLCAFALCAALLLSILPGCGRQEIIQTDPTEPTPEPTQGIQETVLEIQGDERPYVGVQLKLLSLLSADDPRADVMAQAAEVFRMTTGAVVEVFYLSGDEAVLASNLASGVQADIFASSVDALELGFADYALDLTAMAEAADYEHHSYPVLRDQVVQRCGYLAAIPQEPVLWGVYCNADALEAAGITAFPETWADFLTVSRQLTDAGFMPLTLDIETCNEVLELHLQRHLGAQQLRVMLAERKWNQDTGCVDLFQRCVDYAAAGYLAKGDPSALPRGREKIALSNVAMTVGNNLLCGQVERSTLMDVNWAVYPYPGDGEGSGAAVESQVLAVHRESENAQAAFDFIMLLTTGEFDRLYASCAEGIPADPANTSTIRGAGELLAQVKSEGMGLLKEADNELFSRLWSGWYKNAYYFAGAMNELSADYEMPEPEGVG